MSESLSYDALPCLQGIQPTCASEVDTEFIRRSLQGNEGFEFSLELDSLLSQAEALRLDEEETSEFIRQAFLKRFYPLLHTPFKKKTWLARLLHKRVKKEELD